MNSLSRTEEKTLAKKSYAVWTRRPDDPTTASGWIFRRRFEFVSFDRKTFFIGVVATGAAIGGIYLVRASMGKPLDAFSIWLIPILILAQAWKWQNPASKAHAALPTLTDGSDALPVTLTILNEDDKITGRDYGWVTFADGWLVYEGLRASFSLTKASIGHPEYPPAGIAMFLSDKRRIQLTLITDPVQTNLPARRDAADDLHKATRAWLSGPIAEGDPIPPPGNDHPEVVVERLAFPPVYCGFALFVASFFGWLGGITFAAPFLVVALGCFLWLVHGVIRFRRRLPKLIQ